MSDTLCFLKSSSVLILKKEVEINLDFYYGDNTFNKYFSSKKREVIESSIVGYGGDIDILTVSDDSADDIQNSISLYRSLSHLTEEQASDPRLWTYLCHTDFKLYVANRWSKSKSVSNVINHFFVPTGIRGLIRDNAVSRLWWLGYFAEKVSSFNQMSIEDILNIIFYRTDVRANLIERSTLSANFELSTSIINLLAESYVGEKLLFERDTNRIFMKHVNSLGGYKLLDALSISQLDNELRQIISNSLNLNRI